MAYDNCFQDASSRSENNLKECLDLNQASAISCTGLDMHLDFSDGHSIDLRADNEEDFKRWEVALRGKLRCENKSGSYLIIHD